MVRSVRLCPLLQAEVACSPEAPWCGWCSQRDTLVSPEVAPAPRRPLMKMCTSCSQPFQPGSNRAQRCEPCRAEHEAIHNRRFQAEHRARRKETDHEAQNTTLGT